MTLRSHVKFEEKLTCGLENDMSNLANSHQITGKSQNWDFDGILLPKVENDLKNGSYGELCVMTTKNDAKFEEELTCQFKIDMRNLLNFDLSTQKIWKIYTLLSCFWPKFMFELKRYREVTFDGTEEWCKTWRKTDLCSQKSHEQFGKFLPEHSKVSKLGLWCDPFIQSRKCISLNFTGELFVMTMKNDAKFEKKLTCQFKISNKTCSVCQHHIP